jgi:hypothetical protein
MWKRPGWTVVPLVCAALWNCGPDLNTVAECECVTFEQSTVTVFLSELDLADDCFGVPEAYPDRGYERCSTINDNSLVGPIAGNSQWLDLPVAPATWDGSIPRPAPRVGRDEARVRADQVPARTAVVRALLYAPGLGPSAGGAASSSI